MMIRSKIGEQFKKFCIQGHVLIRLSQNHSMVLRHQIKTNFSANYVMVAFGKILNDDNKMNKFNTFAANSPALSDYYSPKHGSQQRFAFPSGSSNDLSRTSALDPLRLITAPHPYNKAYQPDKRIINEDEGEGRQSQGMQSQVSLLMSQVSVPAAPALEIEAPRLFALENNITQHILELREQKITLMQELSSLLDTKNLFEHYLLTSNKDEQQTQQASFIESPHSHSHSLTHSPASNDGFSPLQISAPILKRNEELHLRLKELQIKQEIFGPSFQEGEEDRAKNQRILQEIIQVRELNGNLRDEIANKMRRSDPKDSRFVTFLPQDRQKHFDSKSSLQEYQQLQEKHRRLQALLRQRTPTLTPQESQQLQHLRAENQTLIQQADEMLRERGGAGQLAALQRRLQENQRQKEVFLRELQRFKQTMRQLKDQNERLKAQLAR